MSPQKRTVTKIQTAQRNNKSWIRKMLQQMSAADLAHHQPDGQNPQQQEENRRPDVKLQEPGANLPEVLI